MFSKESPSIYHIKHQLDIYNKDESFLINLGI
jgi:hypothetical protein